MDIGRRNNKTKTKIKSKIEEALEEKDRPSSYR
jgi:hypothetical protein